MQMNKSLDLKPKSGNHSNPRNQNRNIEKK